MVVPCGQCIGCRLERSRQWALRIMHEADGHECNSFLTLTYDDEKNGGKAPLSLRLDDLQRFFKRVRKRGLRMRYYACGEYGEMFERPHFHVCMFGQDFSEDAVPLSGGVHGSNRLWMSEELEALWGHGFASAGELTFESAAYVARYVTKKVTGERSESHYLRPTSETLDTGELHAVAPEFAVMSRGRKRGEGLGGAYLDRFQAEIWRDDSCLARGFESKPPRYYDEIFRERDPEGFRALKRRRKDAASRFVANSTDERLWVRQKVKEAQLRQRKRSYEA